MNTLNFLDANVWLALLWSRHIHSEKAKEWFENWVTKRLANDGDAKDGIALLRESYDEWRTR